MRLKNVYIIGRAVGIGRTQNLVKYLLDQRDLGIDVYYNSLKPNLHLRGSMISGILNRFFIIIHILIKRLFNLYNLAISDIVIVPAMGNANQFELKYARILKKVVITDFFISFYDSQVLDRKNVKPGSKQALKLKKYDFNCINKSNYTLFLNKSESNYYLGLMNIPYNPAKHFIIPLCIEESIIKCEVNYFSKSNPSKVFNICWWGTYIPLHGLEKIIEAAKVLKRDYNLNFHIYLFGTSEEKSKPYLNLIEEYKVSSVISIDNSSTFKNGKLTEFLVKNCDLVLGNFGDSEKAKNVLVNKLIDGVAMKAPVLTGESIAPHEFFSKNEIFYTKNNPELIAEKIHFISQLENNNIMAQIDRAYDIYKKSFSIKAYQKKMDDMFKKLI